MRTLIGLTLMGLAEMVCGQETPNDRKLRDSLLKQQLYGDTVPKKVSLSEIIVKGKKPPVEFKVDRQVFNASAYATAANGSAVEVVRNLPGVAVNGQGDIQLRGSSSFQLLINGRPTQGDPAMVLAQLPANAIDRVEIISTPGAAFDADGQKRNFECHHQICASRGLGGAIQSHAGCPNIEWIQQPALHQSTSAVSRPFSRLQERAVGYQHGVELSDK